MRGCHLSPQQAGFEQGANGGVGRGEDVVFSHGKPFGNITPTNVTLILLN